MNYRNKKVKDVATQELLYELLQRQGTELAPIKVERHIKFLSSLVAIGDNHTAEITLDEESYGVLEELLISYKSL